MNTLPGRRLITHAYRYGCEIDRYHKHTLIWRKFTLVSVDNETGQIDHVNQPISLADALTVLGLPALKEV